MAVAKEQIRQIISENNISSVADVYTLLKDSFKDILQELMEAELDATLGYEKNHKGDLQTDNKRNGHSTKNLKSQYGEFQIDVPRDRNGEFEPKLIPKYQRDISGIEVNNPVPVSLLSGDRGSSAIIRFGSFSMIRYIV